MARLCARLLLGVAGAASLLIASPPEAAAEEAETKTIAVRIEGKDAESMEGAILAIVPETLQVAEPDQLQKALKKAGVKLPLGKVITDQKQRDKVLPKIRKALAAAKIDAAVFGMLRKVGARKELYLIFVDQVPGDLAIDEPIALRGSEADHLRSIDATLGPVLREIAPPPAAKPEKVEEDTPPPPPPKEEEEEEEEEDPSGPRAKNQVGTALFVGELGLELGGRWFSYSDPRTDNLRPYSVFGAPLVAIGAELYPLAGTGTAFIKDLGITLGYARALGLSSELEGGSAAISTAYQRFQVGLRGRIRFGEGEKAAILGLGGGLRLQTFNYEGGVIQGELPDVSYTLLRFGLDGRAPVGPVAFVGGLDFFVPLGSGEVYSRFTSPSELGLGFGGGLAIPIATGLEARVMVDYTRFFSSFSPSETDLYVAGGAVDEYLGIRLGAAYAY